jgi:type VI protein secretion system component VasK
MSFAADDGGTLARPRAVEVRRPWALIAAALILVVLTVVLWVKWRDSRTRAEQLRAELQQVYAEAESLRTQSLRAQQRVDQLERDLKQLSASSSASKQPPPTPHRTR